MWAAKRTARLPWALWRSFSSRSRSRSRSRSQSQSQSQSQNPAASLLAWPQRQLPLPWDSDASLDDWPQRQRQVVLDLGEPCRPWSQRQLLLDLGGLYLYACMRKFYPRFRHLVREEEAQPAYPLASFHFWCETAAHIAKIQAFAHFNNQLQPHPIFSAHDLEALVAAQMLQDVGSGECGSMASMALSVSSFTYDDPPPPPTSPSIKGIGFTNYNPEFMTGKLLLAVFRILFHREVKDVVAQYEQHRLDPECTIVMKGVGTYGLPPLLKLYLNQSFGIQRKTREQAAKGLQLLISRQREGLMESGTAYRTCLST